MSCRLAEIRWSVLAQNPKEFCVSFSRTDSGLCIYHLFVCSILNFLHNSQWITFPAHSLLLLLLLFSFPFGRGFRIRQLLLWRGATPHTPTRILDGEAPVMELWGMWNTPSLPLLPDTLWLGVEIHAWVPSVGQIQIRNHFLNLKPSNCVQTNDC